MGTFQMSFDSKRRNTLVRALRLSKLAENYNLLFPAFFTLAHLALANATNLALPAALIFVLGCAGLAGAFP